MDRKPLKKHCHWPLFFILFIAIGYLPDVLIQLTTPENLVYTGGLVNTDDLSVYYSAIRQGAKGAWLFTPQFSPEPIPAQFSYLPFLLTGKLMALLGGSLAFWYQLLRAASILGAGITLKQLVQTIFPTQLRLQRTAWLLLLFGSGFGWLVSVFSGGFSALAPDLTTPEWNLLTAAYASPHFVLGIAGLAWFFTAVIKGFDSPGWKTLLSGLLAAGMIAIAYPFSAVVVGIVLALYYAIEVIRTKQFPLKKIGLTLAQSLPLLLSLGYYGLVLPQDQLWAETMLSNNQILPPPILGMLLGGGLLLLLSLASVYFQKDETQAALLLVCWLAVNLTAPYLPFSFSGRFVLGMFIPLSLLAAEGLENLLEQISLPNTSPASLRRMIIWLTLPSTILLVLWAFQTGLSSRVSPYYYPERVAAAASFLGEETTAEDIILAEYAIGNFLPREIPGNVFAGHLNLTIDLETKLEEVETFWAPETSYAWRQDLLNTWGITYIFSLEPSLEGEIPGTIIYQDDGITIYQVND